ncbi:hypothetical protein ACEWY4_002674 [Coilia grayii]|uniref:3-beta hydroxysteroid dehydrogenase/isomerase domain-containing protein n=1 Tax=Coilia grayii TaxID=363190 RepID=A0ABD1KP60_9TELE
MLHLLGDLKVVLTALRHHLLCCMGAVSRTVGARVLEGGIGILGSLLRGRNHYLAVPERQRTETEEPGTMKENGGSCTVEPAPCPCLLDGGKSTTRSLNSSRDPAWATNGTSTGTTGAAALASLRNRSNGAVGAWCSSPDCLASRREAAEKGSWGGGKVLVTGGAGYFGFRLGRNLADQGVKVILLDLFKPPWELPEGTVFFQSDIRDYEALLKVSEGVDCIFHTAAYGMSGPEQLKKELVESINVGGTNNVINVCSERGITRLIYTSTVNVAFAGKPIVDGDEDSVPCLPLEMHIDHYSRTKAIADQMVLAANGKTLKGGGVLRTCSLRPSGIYGPEERRHLHRVMVNVERRLFSFSFGNPRAQMNWVHVDNLVAAHLLAAEALTPERHSVAGGQAYFINDGVSVNIFEWFTPLFEKLGYSRPLIHLPVCLVYAAAVLMERVHLVLRPFVEIPLLFTRNEVAPHFHTPASPPTHAHFPHSFPPLSAVFMPHHQEYACHKRSVYCIIRGLSCGIDILAPDIEVSGDVMDVTLGELCPAFSAILSLVFGFSNKSSASGYVILVRNIAISHTFKIDKARRELGYCPKKYSLSEAVDHYLKNRRLDSAHSGPLFSQVFFLVMLLMIGLFAFFICSGG